ncbi:shikimate dehydrogenase [Neorhizobium galegae]|uniref:shikimate dehydrogenase n=1 Tax=Neorhizobium galegae TaxID=399 RepID=UPI0006228688|nr:shikimate dehydrogenase [Neorhizobium galegae]MCQ1769495.1 shikimate dehydrogenase [Neorhizobium galegae]MCQ1849632.1 shikimate dehydrogenase [Neorhizobium galegae]CDZ43287.1 Shikimate dehydrogenase [Neorhizobium galegae bv. officinalis]
MADSRETFLVNAFVTGWPVKHSRSPLIHGYWLEKFEIAGTYRPEAVTEADFPAFIQALKDGSSGFRGGNVTIPHKELAFRLADRPDDLAEELGASNTLWMENGLLHATNTDGHGFTANLDERHPGWDKIDRAVILGAGGASRAVIQAIRDRGVGEVNVVNRTVSRAEELADRFGDKVHAHPVGALHEVMSGAGLFVNTTSLGMDGSEAPKLDFSVLASGAVVTDIVYVPLKTPLLVQAEEQGFPIVDGLGMLLHQAVPGFEKWFGRRPAVDKTLRDLVIADMGSHG